MIHFQSALRSAIVMTVVFCATTFISLGQAPRTFSYQGTLTDQVQTPYPDASYQLTFSLYDAALGSTPVWQEVHSVSTIGGVFDVTLGATSPLTMQFDKQMWLGITLQGNPEMSPRTALVSTPYSLYSELAATATALSPNATGAVLSLNGASGNLTLQGGGKTTVSQAGSTILVSSVGGIDRIDAADGSLSVINPNGPITSLSVADGGIVTGKLADGAVTTSKLSDNAVTSAKVSDGAIITSKLADGSVTTAKVTDGAITNAKINSTGATSGQALTFNGTNVVWGAPVPSGAAGGDLTGNYPNPSVAANAITTLKLADGSVTTPKLADGSITSSKINDGAITTAKVNTTGASNGQALTFNGTNVVWGSPTPSGAASGDLSGNYPNPTVAAGAITTAKLADGSVTLDKLANGSVTMDKIANTQVTAAKVNPFGATAGQTLVYNGTAVEWGSPTPSGAAGGDLAGTYPNPSVASNAITSSKLADGSVTTSKVNDGAITTGKVNTTGATGGQALTFNGTSVVWGSPSPSGAAGGDLTGTYPNPAVAANAITTNKLADGSVTTAKVSTTGAASGQALTFNGTNAAWGSPSPGGAAGGDLTGTYPNPAVATNAITSTKLADGSVTTSKVNDGAITTSKVNTTGASSGQALTFNGTNVVWGSPSPSGAAGGDLTGTYPNPTVATNAITSAKLADGSVTTSKVSDGAITTTKVNSGGAASGQALTFNGTNVVWGSPSPSGAAGGDLSGTYPNPTVAANAITTAKIQDGNVTTSKLADGSVTNSKVNSTGAASGQALTFNGTNVVWGSPSPSGAAGGDLTGTYPNPAVAANAISTTKLADGSVTTPKVNDGAITTSKVNSAGAASGQALTFNGTDVVWGSPTPSGAAGGDLAGNYPNPTVATSAITTPKLADASVTTAKVNSTGATSGQALTYNGTSVVWGSPSPSGAAGGDLTGTYPNPTVAANAITTTKLADGSVTTSKVNDGAITTVKVNSTGATSGQALTFNGTNVVWGSPSPSGTAGGDLTGTYPNPAITTNAVTTSKILDANVTTSKLADASVTTVKVNSTGATSGQALTFNGTNVVWGSPSPSGAAGGDLTGTYPNPTITTNAVTTSKILDANVTTPKLADASVTTAKVNSTGATSGQALTFNGTNVVWGSPSPSGAAGGDLTGNYPNPSIVANAVTTSKILDANVTTAKLADGSVTNAKVNSSGATSGQALTFNGTNVVWGSPSPSGTAGGDLTGTYPNPTVASNAITTAKIADASITTSKVNTTGATVGQALTFNGTNVVWGSPSPSGVAGGDLTGNYPNPTVTANAITTPKLADASVTAAKVNSTGAATGQALTYNGTNVVWGSPSPSGAAGGDLSGTYPNPAVATSAITTTKLADASVTSAKVSSSGATTGQALTFDGTNVVWGSPSPSGAAGGDLTGTYPNPTVASNAITTSKIADASVTSTKVSSVGALSGQALTFNGTNVVWGSPSPSGTAGGDLTGTYPNPTVTVNAITTSKMADASVTTSKLNTTGASSGQALTFNGTNVVWGSPSPSGTAGGDLTGTYPNPTVTVNAITTPKLADGSVTTSKVNDGAITTTKVNSTGATSGQALTFNGTNVVWGSPSPSGAAGGDLTGTYPNPTITTNAVTTTKILDANVTTSKLADASVTSAKLNSSGAVSGQALTFNGTNVVWGSPSPSGAAGGDLTGTYPNPTITTNAITTSKILDANVTTSKLADASVTAAKVNSSGATSGQALTFNGTNVVWGSPSPSGAAGGDLTGTYPNPTITTNAVTTSKILDANVTTSKLADASVTTAKVNSSGATSGQALTFNGTNVVWGSPSPSGAAGGDLTGTYPNPVITANAVTTSKILDANVTTTKLADASVTTAKVNSSGATSGQALTFNGTNVVWSSPTPSGAAGGDLTGTYPNPVITANAVTTSKILDANVTTTKLADASVTTAKVNSSGATSGQALTFNGTNVVWGNPTPIGTAGGDLSGTYPNPTVVKIQGRDIASTLPSNGQSLVWNQTLSRWEPTTPSGGNVVGPASATDNAISRYDATTGKLIQNSAIVIDDFSTTTQNNVTLRADDGSTGNIDLVLSPKGTGALVASKPGGGANARGNVAVDWQMSRNLSSQVASGDYSTISGGTQNTASSYTSTVAGGISNNITAGNYAVISGGSGNTVSAPASNIGGGAGNVMSGPNGVIAGGVSNTNSGNYSAIGGGHLNTVSNGYSTVGGGTTNTASANNSTVSGGISNTASGTSSYIGGGSSNIASQQYATVGGGNANQATSGSATVSGGNANIASGGNSVIAGGLSNSNAGDNSTIAGGRGLTLGSNADRSFGFHANNSSGSLPMTVDVADIAVFGNTNLWLANNDNSASELRFYEAYNASGTFPSTANYTAFKAGTQTGDITYTLPAAVPSSNGQVLASTTAGVMSWVTDNGGDVVGPASSVDNAISRFNTTTGKLIQNSAVLIDDYTTTTQNNVTLRADDGATGNIGLVLSPKGSGALTAHKPDGATAGGNARGVYAVDLQMLRTANTQVASGQNAVVGGGTRNTASSAYSLVAGGYSNTASSNDYATVVGGFTNTASGHSTAIGGGQSNTASGTSSTIAGGATNTVSGGQATIGGGQSNTASGQYSVISGGRSNTASGFNAAISGGNNNNALGDYSTILAGNGLTFTANADRSVGFNANNGPENLPMTIDVANVSVFANTNFWLARNDNVTPEIRFYEAYNTAGTFPNTANYTAFRAGTQTADITYTLPTAVASANGQVLSSTTGGVLSWSTIVSDVTGPASSTDNAITRFDATTGKIIQNSAIIVDDYTTTTQNNVTLRADDGATGNIGLVLSPKGSGSLTAHKPDGTTAGGNARGAYAVDLQMLRSANTQVASGQNAVIGGGTRNTASSAYSLVAGGYNNTASTNDYATVVGGFTNTASGQSSTIGGGQSNTASGPFSLIAGGASNVASGSYSLIGGGQSNTASTSYAVVAGGASNTASGFSSTVSGGASNTVLADFSTIVGGNGLTFTANAARSIGFNGNNNASNLPMTIDVPNVSIFANTNLWLARNDNITPELRFYELYLGAGAFPNATTNYTAFKAGIQSADITYTLPTALPSSNGQVLSSNTSGTMSWTSLAADVTGPSSSTDNAITRFDLTTGKLLQNSAITIDDFTNSTQNNVTLRADDGATNDIDLVLAPKGNGALATDKPDGGTGGGNARGNNAVDLQMSRTAATQVASGGNSAIGGGTSNTATGFASYIGGGNTNTASGQESFVGGGNGNTASGNYSSIPGGYLNASSSDYVTVAGGFTNTASGHSSTIGGGQTNIASGPASTISGGVGNTASGSYASIGAGQSNIASTSYTVVSGGISNTAAGFSSTISGGASNNALADFSTIVGGNGLTFTANAARSIGFNGNNNASNLPMTIDVPNVSVFANTNMWLARNDNITPELRFYELYLGAGAFPNATTNYTAFKAGTQSADITYTLPTALPGTNGQVLSSTTSGIMSWTALAADVTGPASSTDNAATRFDLTTGKLLQNSALIIDDFSSATQNNVTLRADDGATNDIDLVLAPKGLGALTADKPDGGTGGGNARGGNAVDLQMSRSAATQVASGGGSVIAGGSSNTASASNAVIGGGSGNIASSGYGTIAGGTNNTVNNGPFGTVGGGTSNSATGTYASTVAGGNTNTASGHESFVGGGFSNTASAIYTTVSGGTANTASGGRSTISGGNNNQASNAFAAIGGGNTNTASGSASVVTGGTTNTASGQESSVNGGITNVASGSRSSIGGGVMNTAAGDLSAIPGGHLLTLTTNADYSFGFLANSSGGANAMTIDQPFTSVFGNTHLWLANNNSTASQLRFYEANGTNGAFPPASVNYTAFQSGIQASDIVYTLPTAAPTSNGQTLVATTAGVMSWANGNAGDVVGPVASTDNAISRFDATTGKIIQNSAITIDDYTTTTQNNVTLRADDGATADIDLVLAPKGTGALTTDKPDGGTGGGNARGSNAVDLQMSRSAATQVASGSSSFIGGGSSNTASANGATVSGGISNIASAAFGTVGGGNNNTASTGAYATVGGGSTNIASGAFAPTVAGGNTNTASGQESFVGGGFSNTASAIYTTVSGGTANTASGGRSTISGGNGNQATNAFDAIGGGNTNTASGSASVVTGGTTNTASGQESSVNGGISNVASGARTSVGGGANNTAAGDFSAIPGGHLLTLTANADYSFGFLANPSGGANAMTLDQSSTALFGNANLWLANNNSTASQLRFYEANGTNGAFPPATVNYTAFQAGAQTADVIYTLPTAAPASDGQALVSSTAGVMSWATVSAGLVNFTESGNTTAPNATVPVVQLLATNAATNVDVALTPKGTGALTAQIADNTTTGGNKRGAQVVDWQLARVANTQVASGDNSTISGGRSNTATGTFSAIGGGQSNTASGGSSTVAGGASNTASGLYATVAGGNTNQAANGNATVGGGQNNTASGGSATVAGGGSNQATQTFSTVGGGSNNQATQVNATIAGGINNSASALYATVSGGRSNAASGAGSYIGGGGDNGISTGGNTASAMVSSVLGGYGNSVAGDYSSILGGRGLTLGANADQSFGFLANTGTNDMTVNTANTAVFGNTNLWLANNNSTSSELRFYEANATASGAFPPASLYYTAFKAGDQTADLTYTLPITAPTNGQVLSSTAAGVLSWTTAGLTNFTESVNTTAPNATVPVVRLIATNAATDVDIALTPKGNGALTAQVADNTSTGGNKRGSRAVDWQFTRSANTQVASGTYATIGGGRENTAVGQSSVVAGGANNNAGGNYYNVIGGGNTNTTGGDGSTVAGGTNNFATAQNATVAGGANNSSLSIYSTIAGGWLNSSTAFASTVGGGIYNEVESSYSTIPGGYGMRIGNGSFGFNGFSSMADSAYINTSNTAYFGNVNLWLGNTRGVASQMRFYTAQTADGTFPATGTYFSAFQAGAQTADLTYTLPITAPTNGQVLSSTAGGVLSWAAASGLTNFTESANTAAPNATVPVVQLLATNAAANVDVALTPKGTGALTAQVADNGTGGGNKRGQNSVDLQMNRTANTQVSSGVFSTIGGGRLNTASGVSSTVAGGYDNTAGTGIYPTVGGGQSNTASGDASVISGGKTNIASNSYAAITGGESNTANGVYTTVGGGNLNRASGYGSTVGGGANNLSDFSYTTIPGGYGMRLGNAAEGSFGFNGFDNYNDSAYVNAPRTAYFGNVDMWLGNTRGVASQLRFYTAQTADGTFPATGTYFSAFQAGAQAADLTYTLPITAPTNGQVLSSTAGGVLSWASASGLTNFTESVNTAAPNATVPVVQFLATNAATNVDVAISPKGSGALTAQVADGTVAGGNKRGSNAVDWQTDRQNATFVASGTNSTIGGGADNIASSTFATIGGGNNNSATGLGATVAGGYVCGASGIYSTVGGGNVNSAAASYSTVSGGYLNTNQGDYSAIIGGRGLSFSSTADFSVGFLANNGSNNMTIADDSVVVFGNANLWLANNNSTASEIRFYEANAATGAFPPASLYYTAFKAGNQTGDLTYMLPIVAPTNGQVLSSTSGGVLSWATPTLANFTESLNTAAPNATVPVVQLLATYGPASNVDVALTPKGTGALTAQIANNAVTGGNKRGAHATDWQSVRFNASEVASADYSTVSGGVANTASGYISAVSGGYQNTNGGDYSSILGGRGLTFGSTADNSVGFLANSAANDMTINTANTAVFGNTNLWLANNSGTASELRFYEQTGSTSGTFPPAGTNYVAFKSGVNVATDNIYTLPTAFPTGGTGRQLTSTTTGTMSWGAQTLQVNNYNIDCGNMAADGGTAYVNVVVTGAVVGGTVTVSPRGDMEDGVIVAFARVSANDNVRIKFVNATGGAIDPAAINVDVTVVQP